MTKLDMIIFRVLGKQHILLLPIDIVQQKLLAFEREEQRLGKVEFEILHCKNNIYIVIVHTKEGIL